MSRAEVTAIAHLARSAAGSAVEELTRLGLIQAFPAMISPSSPGRPSPQLAVKPLGAYVIAVELQAQQVKLAAVDLGRNILLTRTYDLELRPLGPERSLPIVAQYINKIVQYVDGIPLCGVALSVPGMVGSEKGVARTVLPLDWHDVPVVSLLERYLTAQVPVVIGHDATLGALAEYRCGAGRQANRMLFLTAEPNGLGSAMISRRSEAVYPGDQTLQAGHLSVNPSGQACPCGSRGCLELYVSGSALATALAAPAVGTAQEIGRSLSALSAEELNSFKQSPSMEALRIGLISLVNTLAPDHVIFAGALAPIASLFSAFFTEALLHSVVARAEPVKLLPSQLENAVIIGAAEQAFEPLMHNPAFVIARACADSSQIKRKGSAVV